MADTADHATDELPANSIGALGVTASSLGAIGPTIAIALGLQLVALQVGAATPLAFVVAMCGALAVSYAFIIFSRRIAASGVAFTYLRSVFGQKTGLAAGLVHAGAWLTVTAISTGVASASFSALIAHSGTHVSWFPIFLVLLVIGFAVDLVGIKPSTRILLVLELVSMTVLAVVSLIVIGKGGASGLSGAPFTFHASLDGISGLGLALIFGFEAFAGFEAAAALGKESRNPRRSVPFGILATVLISGIFFVLVSYAVTIGFGLSHVSAFANDSTPLDTITSRYASHPMALIVDAFVGISGFGGTMASMNLSSRVLYTIAKNDLAPAWLGRLHPRFKTPYSGLILGAVITLLIAFCVGLPAGYTDMIGVVAGANGVDILVAYFAVAAAAIWMFGRPRQRFDRRAFNVMVPLVGMAVIAYAIYSGAVPWPSFPFNLADPLGGAWIVICVVIAWRSRDRGFAPVLEELEGHPGPGSVASPPRDSGTATS